MTPDTGPVRIVHEQVLSDLRRLMMGALVLASLFGAVVGYATAYWQCEADLGCITDTECMAECEREGGTDCANFFDDKEQA